MLSAIAARKARLQISSIKSSIKRRRHHHHPAAVKKARRRKYNTPPKAHSENKNVIVTTSESSESNPKQQQDVVSLDLDHSDSDSDMSITLDQENPQLIQPERSLEPTQRERRKVWSPSLPVVYSSDDASDASDEEPVADISQRPYNRPLTTDGPERLSTYHPVPEQNMFQLSPDEASALGLSGPAVVLVLSPSLAASFVGAYRMRVLRGSISLLGIIIHPSRVPHHVFAPRSSPIPVIQALVVRGESSKSLASIPSRILSIIDQGDVVIVLQELRTGIGGLGRVVRTFEGVFDQAGLEETIDVPLEGIHVVIQATRGMCAFQLPPSWEMALSASPLALSGHPVGLRKPHVLLVKGQKNSGKSTFARALVNRLSSWHRRVAFLECDLGQSEFTPGGMVALSVVENPIFGPPFTHPTLPHQAHYVGAHNPRSSPSHYLRAIQSLIETYRLDLQFASAFVDIEEDREDDRITDVIPLVVNTMGWTKGLGSDLARRIEELVQPTDIFLFDTSPPDGVEPDGPRVHTLEPVTPSPRFTASDHRALSLLSYFHAVFPNPIHSPPLRQTTASLWSTKRPLCARPPYELTTRLALDRIVLTGAGAEDVVRTELWRVLTGALVALVSSPSPSEGDEELFTPGSPPPDPASSTCLGLAFIRGVSSDGSKLQLLTPVPPETLVNARVLVMGELELPVWGWLDFRSADGGAGVDVPFLQWGRNTGAGSERRRVRRNIMRRAQM
ncbi:hypothetical protein B0F90DRAFT_1627954 [Multifurca ochricompacta]|uniref:Polynucleotide 5'-hydroxyl-kinase GRC3 n=1 Tax=Multifurca ochricompacta TaxID=376703 RepID=A0AAD4QLI2_9AGAM|nr:hypothetical protein B0F90DRAFT_1627954 [Multifurca ochricompacta]